MLLTVTRRGEKLLKQLALAHRAELKTARSKLLQALINMVARDRRSGQAQAVKARGQSEAKRDAKQQRARRKR